MQINSKRQKFANDRRKQQREQMFRKGRGMYSSQDDNHKGQFIFMKEFLDLDPNPFNLQQNIMNGEIKRMLNTMPKWIASLGLQWNYKGKNTNKYVLEMINSFSSKENSQQVTLILQKLVLLSGYCLTHQHLIFQVTNCLVQLTSFPTQFLSFLGIPEQKLIKYFIQKCQKLIKTCTDLRIIFNCIYICGNLHETLIKLALSLPTNTHINIGIKIDYRSIKKFQNQIIDKLEELCHKYNNYSNCIEILLWYMKNCILISRKQQQNISQYSQISLSSLTWKYTCITSRIIISVCSKLVGNQSGCESTQMCILKSAFNLLYFVVPAYFKHRKSPELQIDNEQYLDRIIKMLDQCISTYLSIYKQNLEHLKGKPINKLIMSDIAQVMLQLMLQISQVSHNAQKIPPSFLDFCRFVCEGNMQIVQGCELCFKILQILNRSRNQIHTCFIVRDLLKNSEKVFRSCNMVGDRNYRVEMLKLIFYLLDWISYEDLKNLITYQFIRKDQQRMQEQTKKGTQYQYIQEAYQKYMFINVLPSILNILHLLLIDEEAYNQAMGLKMILKLSTHWELSSERLRDIVISMNMHNTILLMQQEKDQIIYSSALDVIEELQLDDLEW